MVGVAVCLYADAVSRTRETDSPDLVSHIRGSTRRRSRRTARAVGQVHVARFGPGTVSIVG